ncbi:MAG: dihydropteroate synthase [Limimaricola sp.]|uniref:dihydropteroate synthase n=1 Tax=Limimaricola sp. TaxID=2211665 RepID=UPI001D9D1535|nr:dihydropteroate synthase [Limimaricola sp.]MBI1416175.1 dihydropteroate synthase [Limimaricola sp.]
MTARYRPIPFADPGLSGRGLPLGGGWMRFAEAEKLSRGAPPQIVPLSAIPDDVLERLSAPRAPLAGLTMDRPRLMGILNVTPDSFSDGGHFDAPEAAQARAKALVAAGADIVDIGGESTRPGAAPVPAEAEIARTAPVIAAIRADSAVPISIDTRKAAVATAAIAAGASMVNDVAAFTYDPELRRITAEAGLPCCLMHAQGDPQTMQDNPRYDDVVLDIYDFLEARVAEAEAAGIPRARIAVDPGIGFGKTLQHNVTLLRALSVYHGLGCAILLGASRKRFIGTLSGVPQAADRGPGSVAVALHGVAQGVQILRVHDMMETRQALRLSEVLLGLPDERMGT